MSTDIRGSIYSDDPQAVEKLRDKLARLNTQQKRMKALNAAWRKAKKPAPDDVVGWGKIADTLGQDLWQLDRIRVNMARDCLDRAPYTYQISNNNSNMKRIKDRIVELVEARERRERRFGPADEPQQEEPQSEWFPPPNAN